MQQLEKQFITIMEKIAVRADVVSATLSLNNACGEPEPVARFSRKPEAEPVFSDGDGGMLVEIITVDPLTGVEYLERDLVRPLSFPLKGKTGMPEGSLNISLDASSTPSEAQKDLFAMLASRFAALSGAQRSVTGPTAA